MIFTSQSFKMRSLRNRHLGKRAFILGNGPSINSEDLSVLQGEITIGMNASTILEKKHGFTQTYHCVSDRRFLLHPEKRKYCTYELSSNTVRILRKDLMVDDDQSFKARTLYSPHLNRDGFSNNLEMGFFYGCTTTMLAIQLAAHLGLNAVYLLGVDLKYRGESPRFYREDTPQLEDSFTSVQIWNIANAYRVLQSNRVDLFSCSSDSALRPYLPFKPLNEVVS